MLILMRTKIIKCSLLVKNYHFLSSMTQLSRIFDLNFGLSLMFSKTKIYTVFSEKNFSQITVSGRTFENQSVSVQLAQKNLTIIKNK